MICPGRLIKHSNCHKKSIHCEDLNDWLKEFIKNNSNKNSLRNNNQCTSRDTKELQISMGDEEEKELHEEDRNSLPNDFEKDEETSHEKEEEYLETIEYHILNKILLWTWTKENLLMDA